MNQGMNAGFLLALLAALPVSCILAGAGPVIRMQLSHADAGGGGGRLTPGELLQRMVLRSKARATRFFSGSSPAVVPAGEGEAPFAGEYLVSFGIGTPPQRVKMTLDTGSDLVWTQCQPCVACYDQAPFPYLDTSASTTFSPFPCNSSTCQHQLPWPPPSCCGAAGNVTTTTTQQGWGSSTGNSQTTACVYTYQYADMSVTNGVLAADTFTFDGVAFGCGVSNQGLLDFNSTGTGIAGFGRGALSLPSQLKVDNFSYCFTDIAGSTPSAVLLGLPASLYYGGRGGAGAGATTTTVQTTPFNVTSSSSSSSYYYLNLQGISVGSTTLDVPASAFALNADGGVTGGTVIDSGTSITLLPPHVYGLLRDAFVSELNTTSTVAVASLPDDVLCFPATAAAAMPTLRLRFDGGATMEVPPENYVFPHVDGDTVCIAMAASSGGDNTTVIGNYQQQNMHVLYDLAGNTLSFVPAQCDKLVGYDDLAAGSTGDTLPFDSAQCDKLVCSTASRRAVLHAGGCVSSLCPFLSIATVVFVLTILY